MADAAYAGNIPPGFPAVAGYYGGPQAYHVWPSADWAMFPGAKLPIWVAGQNGTEEGQQAVAALRALAVPVGVYTALDMEDRHDKTYVLSFQAELNHAGYLVWDYGSLSEIYRDPEANGFWVADYTSVGNAGQVLAHAGTRAVQYAADVQPGYDISMVKEWCFAGMWR
jgi:hypothetical protein